MNSAPFTSTHFRSPFPLPLPIRPPVTLRSSSRRVNQRAQFSSSVHLTAVRVIAALNRVYAGPLERSFMQPDLPSVPYRYYSIEPSSPSLCFPSSVSVSTQQLRLLSRVFLVVASFLRSCRGVEFPGASDQPTHPVCHTGAYSSTPERAIPLVASRVALPTSPPSSHLLSLLPHHLQTVYASPSSSLLAVSSLPSSHARVLGSHSQYISLLRRMADLGMIDFTSSPAAVNGVFAVRKDACSQRLIIDATNANTCFHPPPHTSLPSPELFCQLVVPSSSGWCIAKSDISHFYHSILLPSWLRPYFALPAVDPFELGLSVAPSSARIFPMCTTMPMGWSHSVFLAQALHEHIISSLPLFTNGSASFLSNTSNRLLDHLRVMVYIDDVVWMDVCADRARSGLSEYVNRMRALGFVLNDSKVTWPSSSPITALGYVIDPRRFTVSTSPSDLLALIHDTRALILRGSTSSSNLSALVGRWIWSLLIVRPALSILHHTFQFIQKYSLVRQSRRLWSAVLLELQLLSDLAPLFTSSIHVRIFPRLVATDSSSRGAAVVFAQPPASDLLAALSTSSTPSATSCTPHDESSLPASTTTLLPSVTLSPPLPIYSLLSSSLRWRIAFSWPWAFQEHINVLELRSVLFALTWLISFPSALSSSIVLLCDSLVALSVLCKGRSSSFPLLVIMRRIAALLLSSGILLHPVWIPSLLNPADSPSRQF